MLKRDTTTQTFLPSLKAGRVGWLLCVVFMMGYCVSGLFGSFVSELQGDTVSVHVNGEYQATKYNPLIGASFSLSNDIVGDVSNTQYASRMGINVGLDKTYKKTVGGANFYPFKENANTIHIGLLDTDEPLLSFSQNNEAFLTLTPYFDKTEDERLVFEGTGGTLMSVTDKGYVGIGLATPKTPLHIKGHLFLKEGESLKGPIMSEQGLPIWIYQTLNNSERYLHFVSIASGGDYQYAQKKAVTIANTSVGTDISTLYKLVRKSFWLKDGASWASTSKTFIIQHPLAANKHLIHAASEGPESAVFYSGTAQFENGMATVKLPDYVAPLIEKSSETLLFTTNIPHNPIKLVKPLTSGLYEKLIQKILFWKTSDPILLTFQSKAPLPNQHVFWELKGKRSSIDVEPLKSSVVVNGEGPYLYLMPREGGPH